MARLARCFALCALIALSGASKATTCSELSAACSASSAEADTSILLQRPVHVHVVEHSIALEDESCVNLTGLYAVTHSGGGNVHYKTIISPHACGGEIAGNWKFTVEGNTITGTDSDHPATGTITGTKAGEDMTIQFNNGWTYTYKACVDLNGTYNATRHGGTPWEATITSTDKIQPAGCSGKIGGWDFAVAGDTIYDSHGSNVGTITGTGMPSTITMKFKNGFSYTKPTCVDLNGKYTVTHRDGGDAKSKNITSTDCQGSIDGEWMFTVAGDTITGSDGTTGTITGTHAGIDMTITFTNGYTYTLDACVHLNGAYEATKGAHGNRWVDKSIEVDQTNNECTGVIKCAQTDDWHFTVTGVTITGDNDGDTGTITGTGKLSLGATIQFDNGWTYSKKMAM